MLIIVLIGIFMDKKGWVDENAISFVSKLVNNVCLPPLMFVTMLTKVNSETMMRIKDAVWLPFLSMLLAMILCRFIGSAMKIDKQHLGIFTTSVGLSNSVFIGMPVCISLFGDVSIPFVMTYYFGNTLLFWTLGIQQIASCGEHEHKIFSMETLKSVASPPLMSAIVGVLFLMCGLSIPAFVIKPFSMVGNMTTPLAMLFIGFAVSRAKMSEFTFDRKFFVALIGRFILSPAILVPMALYTKLDPFVTKVFFMMASMPSMANIAIITKHYNGDYKYAAGLTTATTCLACIVIPVYMYLSSILLP